MKHLEIRKEGQVCWVYLNRPKSLNALNTDILKELTEFNASLRKYLESRVIIYTGTGDNFSSWADLKEKSQKVALIMVINYSRSMIRPLEIDVWFCHQMKK